MPLHQPGEGAIYTDDELKELPFVVLSEAQRKRKRIIERRERTNKRNSANRKVRKAGEVPDRTKGKEYCVHIKENGDRCGSWAAYGTPRCRWHMDEEEKIAAGLAPARPGEARQLVHVSDVLTPMQQFARATEKSMAVIIEQYLTAMGLQLDGFDPLGDPIISVVENGGLKLHGESKDGDIIMTNFDNIIGRIEIAEKMINRVWGKPRQSMVIEGGAKPIKIEPKKSPERAQDVAKLLDGLGIIPRGAESHGTAQRRRRAPAEPTTTDKTQESTNGKKST